MTQFDGPVLRMDAARPVEQLVGDIVSARVSPAAAGGARVGRSGAAPAVTGSRLPAAGRATTRARVRRPANTSNPLVPVRSGGLSRTHSSGVRRSTTWRATLTRALASMLPM